MSRSFRRALRSFFVRRVLGGAHVWHSGCGLVWPVKVVKSMWAEFLIGISIILTLLSVSLASFTGYDHERSEFNRVTRTFYFDLKRYQLQAIYGSTYGGKDRYTFYADTHYYKTQFYSERFGEVVHPLPDTMALTIYPRGFSLQLTNPNGQKMIDRIVITDSKLKRGRNYVFSQQTARIRWTEQRYY